MKDVKQGLNLRKADSAFSRIQDEAGAVKFLEEYLPSPVGKTYYTPMDYRWYTMPLAAGLRNYYMGSQKLISLMTVVFGLLPFAIAIFFFWDMPFSTFLSALAGAVVVAAGFILKYRMHRKEMVERFEFRDDLALSAFVREMDPLGDWVKSRYAINPDSFLIPRKYASLKWELDELDEDERAQLDDDGMSREDVDYYWKQVEPGQESLTDGRIHCILVGKKTHLEAPLLPGVEPYQQ